MVSTAFARNPINVELITRLYVEQGQTAVQIAMELECSEGLVYKILKREGIERRKAAKVPVTDCRICGEPCQDVNSIRLCEKHYRLYMARKQQEKRDSSR